MAGVAEVDESAAPCGGEMLGAREGRVRVGPAGHDNAREWQPSQWDRAPATDHASGIFPLDVGGCDEKRAGDSAGAGRIGLRCPRDRCNAAEALRDQLGIAAE